tara:strand:+ start:238 stop:471 length:234 start_codon:yes stop_codon:yes gene_type:complete
MNLFKDFKPNSNEDYLNLALIFKPIGSKNSGYDRYSAAMYFYNKGLMSEELLEIYRICCKFDKLNPLNIAANKNLKF